MSHFAMFAAAPKTLPTKKQLDAYKIALRDNRHWVVEYAPIPERAHILFRFSRLVGLKPGPVPDTEALAELNSAFPGYRYEIWETPRG